jgi:DUF438 domain-containing protein
MNTETYKAVLDSINHPIVFVDNEHIIRYLNKPAKVRYYEKRGYSNLIGKSLFDCHNPASEVKIKHLHKRLQQGEDEIFLMISKNQEKITVVGVRDHDGRLIGYYERFEKIASSSPVSE